MAIEVELPDGTIAEFPDGTDNATMERALSAYRTPQQKRAPAASKSARPNFSDVTSRVIPSGVASNAVTPRSRVARVRANAEADAIRAQAIDPLQGMSGLQRAGAGFGAAYMDLWNGGKQRGIDQLLSGSMLPGSLPIGAEQVSAGLRTVGLDRAAGAVDQYAVNPLLALKARQQAAAAAEREATIPIRVGSGAGILGNITGTVSQVAIPGIGGRNIAGIRANAAQGGLLGYLQPSASDQETAINTGLGIGFGGVGAGAVKAGAAGKQWIASKIAQRGLSRAEKRAGKAVLEAAGGPVTRTESQVPGVTRTLGDATLNDGVSALEREMRRIDPLRFTTLDNANNAARVSALEKIAGDEIDMEAAIRARDAAAGPLYREAGPIQVQVDDQLKSVLDRIPRSVISSARRLASIEGKAIPEDLTVLTGDQLHYVKLALDNALSRAGPGGLGSVEQRALSSLKEDLTSTIGRAIPQYADAMQGYAQLSKPISRMQIGQELIRRTRAAQDDALGNPKLLAGKFGSRTRDLNELARSATKFKKARASDYLSGEDFQTIAAVNDDLRRQANRQQNPAQAGSATNEAARIVESLVKKGVLQNLGKAAPFVGGFVEVFQRGSDEMKRDALIRILTDPATGNKVLSAMTPAQRAAVNPLLISLSGHGTAAIGREKVNAIRRNDFLSGDYKGP